MSLKTYTELMEEYNNRPYYEKVWDWCVRKVLGIWRFFRYDIPNGIKGLIYWASFAWNYRTWDWQYGMIALEMHLVKLEVAVRNGYSANREKDADDIRLALALMKRLREDKYYEEAEKLTALNYLKSTDSFKHANKQKQEDWNYLFDHMRDKMQRWWD